MMSQGAKSMQTNKWTYEKLTSLLQKASADVDKKYCIIKRSGNKEEVYRERVFCYEFYHKLRTILGNAIGLSLHGEIDKSGDRKFSTRVNPDFILHSPGNNDFNLGVVEVKVTIRDKNSINKDLKKILGFINNHQYNYGFFLLINYTKDEFIQKSNWDGLSEEKNIDKLTILYRESINVKETKTIKLNDLLKEVPRSNYE